jgi:large subunit ribosomal protein L23
MPEPTKAAAKSASVEAAPTGRVLESYQVILRPLVTEKGMHRSTRNNQYSFEINTQATKADVRRAVEDLFNVKVEKVCTQNRKGKHRRHRQKQGMTKGWKKAVVTLNAEHRIDFF